MKKGILILFILLSTHGYAHSETKQEKIAELVQVMDMDAMVDAMYAQMVPMMKNMSKEMGVTDAEGEIFDKYYDEMTTVLREEMSWAKMEPAVIEIYNKNFSEKEISDMLAFYKTESGQSILKKMPAVSQESMMMGQSLARAAFPKIQAVSKELGQVLKESRASKEQ